MQRPVYLFIQHLLGSYCVPDTVLSPSVRKKCLGGAPGAKKDNTRNNYSAL